MLRVEDLRVGFGRIGAAPVVDGVSFELTAGRAIAIVGESGSGKSVTARSLVGLAGAGSWQTATALEVLGESLLEEQPARARAGAAGGGPGRADAASGDLRLGAGDSGTGAQRLAGRGLGLSARAWQRVRGRRIGLVVQDALVSLDPLRPIGREIGDALRLHTRLGVGERHARVLELLEAVGMPEPEVRVRQRSGELSGGLRQRALIASALAADPAVLIADEPTTALDSTVQAQILDLFDTIKARGTSLLFISHDLAVVSRIADEVLVMRGGRVVESGPIDQVLGSPRHDYTRALLRAVPTGVPRGLRLAAPPAGAVTAMPVTTAEPPTTTPVTSLPTTTAVGGPSAPVLEVRGVTKTFPVRGGPRGGIRSAVDDVTLTLERGATLGIVGESGSGKTTLARIVLGLTEPDSGSVSLLGEPWVPGAEKLRRPRRRLVGAVYQDALSSFDPRLTVGQILADALGATDLDGASSSAHPSAERVAALLADVALDPALARVRPLQLSGGQRQRVSIARALAPQPDILVCDEPVSALDVSVQAQILDLLDELQQRRDLSYLFISHDLGVIGHMSDRVAVMKNGRVLEQGATADVFADPHHDYTRALLAAAPRLPARG
ncbi:ABC transporter ATP-binding protein [Herbiconiux sp. CPCC 203386]|uniref:ABC transporter ATP-binding protein n=1 Tax=Herbiconiux daphne TaxID=2970914 RepID=A0ABT2H0Y0_9MICO|nr:ABC transporter ATP-binding protein [Herbiconiux daphne]MCS5733586.1 ABC transporter ATP-binding protein [Herbiconiux daphne]